MGEKYLTKNICCSYKAFKSAVATATAYYDIQSKRAEIKKLKSNLQNLRNEIKNLKTTVQENGAKLLFVTRTDDEDFIYTAEDGDVEKINLYHPLMDKFKKRSTCTRFINHIKNGDFKSYANSKEPDKA